MSKVFDPQVLESVEYRKYFQLIQTRIDEVLDSVTQGYGMPDSINEVNAFIAHELAFNGSASIDGKVASLSINASVLLSLRLLFDQIVSLENVLPGLNNDEVSEKINYEAQFFADTSLPRDWQTVSVTINQQQFRASAVLADLCVTFVFLHEFGHLLCGHIEAAEQYFSETPLLEMFDISEDDAVEPKLRRFWEFQADSVAASILSQYIGTLIDNVVDNHTWVLDSANLKASQTDEIAIHVTAMVNAALHVLFLYMDGCKFKTHKASYHPPAQARIKYIIEIVSVKMEQRLGIDSQVILDTYYDVYLGPFIEALKTIGLGAFKGFEDDHLDIAKEMAKEVKYNTEKYRDICQKWSWIPLEQWHNPPSGNTK